MAVPMSAMTSLSGKVSQSILDRTDAEKVFCPWWDGLEDIDEHPSVKEFEHGSQEYWERFED